MKRRELIKTGILAPIAVSAGLSSCNASTPMNNLSSVKHSACRWCYNDMPLELLCEKAKDLGLQSIELLNPEEWGIAQKKGLNCAISNGSKLGITQGFNDPNLHAQLFEDYKSLIEKADASGIDKIICFSGNRNGISDELGLENCAKGLDAVVKLAEQYNISIVMELLNSKIDHADYQCDKTPWGVALAEKIGSPSFSLLYDIYHMQIMEGDVIRTIQDNAKYISHFHTGGVPGRNEIDETQELNYRAIIDAIMATGYQGYIAQEFIPKSGKPMESLKKAIDICSI